MGIRKDPVTGAYEFDIIYKREDWGAEFDIGFYHLSTFHIPPKKMRSLYLERRAPHRRLLKMRRFVKSLLLKRR